jgi:DNA helicase-2/ATP-dependent DNA helicase PcrA
MSITIQELWGLIQPKPFTPNPNQERAILHIGSPLFLTAGPGSGKTRVLLWRTLNLLVFHDVKPEEIFLGTFTEKAAFQLKEGLRSLLGLVTNLTGTPYDVSRMYVGTVHSLCQR